MGTDGVDGVTVDTSGAYSSGVNTFGEAGQNTDALAAQFKVALQAAQQTHNDAQSNPSAMSATATAQALPNPQVTSPPPNNNGFGQNISHPFQNVPANDNNKSPSVWDNAKDWAAKGAQFVGRNGPGIGVIGAELTAGKAALDWTQHNALWAKYGGNPDGEQVPTALTGPWYASPENASTVPSQYDVQIPGGQNLNGQMTYPDSNFSNSKLTVYGGADRPIATYDVKWGQNDYLWMGQIKDPKGNVVGYTDPISVYPGGRAMTGTNLDAAELNKLNAQASDLSMMAGKPKRGAVDEPGLYTTNSRTRTGMKNSSDPCGSMSGQRHHVLAADLMEQHKDLMKKTGFELDKGLTAQSGPDNLIRLPSNETERADMKNDPQCGDRTIHNGSHDKYSDAVSEKLTNIKEKLDAGRISVDEARSELGRLMQNLQQELTSGKYGTMNDPALISAIRAMTF